MRLPLVVLFAGVLLAIPVVTAADAVLTQESRAETAGSAIGTTFDWPAAAAAADPEVALRVLTEAATATGSNVVRTIVNTPSDGQKRIRHYVLLGREHTALFDGVALTGGRLLSQAESREGTATVSSVRAGEPGNVGVPAVFGDRYELTFAPLRQAFEVLPAPGRYVVESADSGRFLSVVRQQLVEAGVDESDVALARPDRVRFAEARESGMATLAYVLSGLAALLLAFILLREGKRIGVLRLLGFSAPRIWFTVVGRLQLFWFTAGLVALAVVAVTVSGVDVLLLRTLVGTLGQVAAAGFAATLGAGLIVINRVRVSDLVKGSLQ